MSNKPTNYFEAMQVSARNGLKWIKDNKLTYWQKVAKAKYKNKNKKGQNVNSN